MILFQVRLLLSAIVLCICLSISVSAQDAAAPQNTLRLAAAGVRTLQSWYVPDTGLYQTTGWWNSANATTVLVDYSRISGTQEYTSVLANTLSQAQKKYGGFLNTYYDDEGWWALAWIDAYDLTHDRQYLAMAQSIFADMTGGWDETCGGGIWWSKDRKYKNAIANELFLSVAAHLAVRLRGDGNDYRTWAQKEWQWFRASGMINAQNLVNDGLDLATCKNNLSKTWTYNQGVIVGGLVELNRVSPDPELIRTAQDIAGAAITHLITPEGILSDGCEPNCGDDGVQFKGIFMRNLSSLEDEFPNRQYAAFLQSNARSIETKAQGPGNQFGQAWTGPFDVGNAGSQSSALDALLAAAKLSHRVQRRM